MVLRKVIPMIVVSMLGIASCQMISNPNKDGFDEGAMRNDLLRQMTRDVFYQDSMMRVIHSELDRIDVMYVRMENAESRGAQRNQAEAIVKKIKHLNGLLETTRSEMKKSSLENKGLLEVIERFKKDLIMKENKIKELQEMVKSQEIEITEKGKKIDYLELLSNQQKEEIARMEKEIEGMKSTAYSELADLLVQISTEMPEVKGMFTKRTKENVVEMQQGLIRDAYRYYNEAVFLGNNYAQTRSIELKNAYNFLQ